MKKATKTSKLLPPDLARPIQRWVAIMMPADERKLYDLRVERMQALVAHYGLSSNDPSCWKNLCVRLALDYIPGLQLAEGVQRAPGRPRKEINEKLPKRKRGRAKTWDFDSYDSLLRMYQGGASILRKTGEARITDRAALLAWIKADHSPSSRGLTPRLLEERAGKLAKRLPDARKSVQQFLKK